MSNKSCLFLNNDLLYENRQSFWTYSIIYLHTSPPLCFPLYSNSFQRNPKYLDIMYIEKTITFYDIINFMLRVPSENKSKILFSFWFIVIDQYICRYLNSYIETHLINKYPCVQHPSPGGARVLHTPGRPAAPGLRPCFQTRDLWR